MPERYYVEPTKICTPEQYYVLDSKTKSPMKGSNNSRNCGIFDTRQAANTCCKALNSEYGRWQKEQARAISEEL